MQIGCAIGKTGEGVYCLTIQQEKVYKKLYKACGVLNWMEYDEYIKAGNVTETQPFKSHDLTVKIINAMGKVIRGEIDPNEGLAVLREEDVKNELIRAREYNEVLKLT
jgi:hypothetical protein